MKYIALLRGINVGKSIQIKMEDLKQLFINKNYQNVKTYINSGNVYFETNEDKQKLQETIEMILLEKFQVEIKVVVKTMEEMKRISSEIPISWMNDENQKTDVAYLFDEIDAKELANELPIKREFINIVITNGAIIWNVSRDNYNKSNLNKIISHQKYKEMTVRNVNTARKLALM
jgi:uncharacterized protein (DUF1697 family)